MWINREISEKLNQFAKEFPAIVLTGARQVGKSSLLAKLFPNYQCISLDLPANAELAKFAPESFLTKYNPPLIIDEIQYAPELLRYIKIWIDKHRELRGQFLITGSQKFELMKNVTESLAGRAGIIELLPLSFREILSAKPYSLENLIFRGGYPELYQDDSRSAVYFYQSYLSTYLERDIRTLLRVSSLSDFGRFLKILALRAGQIVNKADIARDTGVSAVTVNEWLNLLVISNQITLLEPYFNNKTKRLTKSPKLYFNDTGVLSSLLGITSETDLLKMPNIGAIWENTVFIELLKTEQLFYSAENLYFWRDSQGVEVDFLIERAGTIQLIEVKLSEHPTAHDLKNIDKVIKTFDAKRIESVNIICRTTSPYPIQLEWGNAEAISLFDYIRK